MKTSSAGRAAIAQREGNILKAYPDPATGGEPFTIGVGHTSAAGPPKVTKGMKITAAESDTILTRDLATFEAAVERAVKVAVSQNEFDALVSLAFNIGAGAFAKSTLVKKLNAGDRAGAANAFLSWNRAAGKVMPGLTTRRKAERAQFLSGKPVQVAAVPNPTLPPAPTPPPVRTDTILRRGSRGPLVGDLQNNLNTLGYGPLMVDEVFGADTEKAVMAFQLAHGLKVDGWAGGRTSTEIGKAISDRDMQPKLEEAEKTVPVEAKEEVKEKTGFPNKIGGWFGGLGIGGAGIAQQAFEADWKTVVAIGAVAVAGSLALIFAGILLRRLLLAAFKDINEEASK